MTQASPPETDPVTLIQQKPQADDKLAWFILLVILIFIILVLPPISLAQWWLPLSAGANGYELVDSGGGSVQTADGTQVTFLADGMNGPIWVKLEALPSSAVKAGTGDDELAAAAEALPPGLTPASPYYQLQQNLGNTPRALALAIPLPATGATYQTLDLYVWNGQSWDWQPHRQLRSKNVIETDLNFMPRAFALMQSAAVQPELAADYSSTMNLSAEALAMLTEIYPLGLLVHRQGHLVGQLEQISAAVQDQAIIPTIRNWTEYGAIIPLDDLRLLISTYQPGISGVET